MDYAWDDQPPESAERFLAEGLERHSKVRDYEQDEDDPQIWRVRRWTMKPVEFYYQNVYIFGIADYEAVRNAYPKIRCVVTAGNWNYFTDDVTERAAKDRVALFDFSGLFGALNKDADAFYRHVPRD